MNYKYIQLSLSSILLCIASPAAFSQDQQETFILEEVIVTAQKRSQSLQDVPVAVSALTGQQITDASHPPKLNLGSSARSYVFLRLCSVPSPVLPRRTPTQG